MNKILFFILIFLAACRADVCDELYVKNKVRWEKNDNMELCKQAIEGDADAQFDLAAWYQLEEKKTDEALKWLLKSVDQGCAKSQYVAGLMYHDGAGVEADWYKAIDLMKKSAESGVPQAQYMMGYFYFYGHGTAQNDEKAIELFKMAAKNQDAKAFRLLSTIYEEGDGVPVDKEKAKFYSAQVKMAEIVTAAVHNTYPCDRYRN